MKTVKSNLQLQKQDVIELNDSQLQTVKGGSTKCTTIAVYTSFQVLTVYIPDPR